MFKKGDKVRRIQGCHEEMKVGDVAVVEGYNKYDNKFLLLCGYGTGHSADNFELVEDTISSWLKENAWFIRVESSEHSKLIQEWLFDHGIGWAMSGEFTVYGTEHKMLTNYSGGHPGGMIMWAVNQYSTSEAAQELLPQFKLTLEGITLPEAPQKTEQQLRLEELEATIQKAQQEIQKASAEVQALKEMK